MATQDVELTGKVNTGIGMDSFNDSSLENELELCKELGFNVEKLKEYKFNALQLAEIRKGLADKVDVNKYLSPRLSWIEMEEIRLEMYQDIDMTEYRKQGFDTQQLSQIRQGIAAGIDVSVYAKKEYLADQMEELRLGLVSDKEIPVIFYLDSSYNSMQMREIRKGLEEGLDVSSYASVGIPYMKMRTIRESAEDGLFFDSSQIQTYNAGVLEQMHKAFVDDVDISRYIKDRYDAEQIEEIRISLKENIPIDSYISSDMRGDAIKEIRIGIENGVIVDQYADASYGWMQMREMRLGLEHQIEITPYCKPLYQADQMREIRLGIEEGLDISQFSTMMYTARDMRRIRKKMLAGEWTAIEPDTDSKEESGESGTVGNGDAEIVLRSMLENRDMHLSFTHGNMLCWLMLPLRADGASYTEDIVLSFLQKCNIRFGIDKKAISDMLKNLKPSQKYLVAAGRDVVDGEDGYYEYFFDINAKTEPIEKPDGTVDLSRLDSVIRVNVGEKIAEYHRATKGTDGCDVYGNVIQAKRGKEIPILKGEGFTIMNDRVSYVAKYTGAINVKDGDIFIQKIMIVPEVKITDKTIRYDGTVLVTGDVFSGSEIHATGDIIISGHMESAVLVSGGNVAIRGGATCPIRGGATCPIRGGVDAKGDVSAKFFEGVRISGRNVSANSFVNCNITAKGLVKTFGRDGIMYGGTIQSLFGVETANIGSKAGAKTIVNLGVGGNLLNDYKVIEKTLLRETEELKALNKERDRLQEIGAASREQMQWKIKINAAVGMKESKISELIEQKEALEDTINKGNNAKAVITEMMYAGTIFVISGVIYRVENDRKVYDPITVKADAKREHVLIL